MTARAMNPARGASCNLTYESAKGYLEPTDTWDVPNKAGWPSHTFTLQDAYFANSWG